MSSPATPSSLAARLLDHLGRWVRRGDAAAPSQPRRRRLLLLQIDGLSSARLAAALDGGYMPHLARRLRDGRFRIRRLTTATAPSTPVFQAGLLYGRLGDIPGFGWYDRRLGRRVRMDLAEDVEEVQRELDGGGRGLLEGGVSYGTLFTGRALDTFFNVIRWGRPEATPDERRPRGARNAWDHLASATITALVAARLVRPFCVELVAGLWDLGRFFRRERTTRSEWRFLYMRLFTSVILREVETFGLILDVMRGVPILYADYFGYDEYAHRRGPDSALAFWNLGAIDADLDRVLRAVERVPEYRYEVYILSDHGQSAATPFERIAGESLEAFVLARAAPTGAGSAHEEHTEYTEHIIYTQHTRGGRDRDAHAPEGAPLDEPGRRGAAMRALVTLRALRFWAHAQRRPVRALLEPWLSRLERHAEARLRLAGHPIDRVRVVPGGSIAHVYLGHRQRAYDEELAARWPLLLESLARSPAVGLVATRGGGGPIVYYRGVRYRLADRARLASLRPFRLVGYDLLAGHLRAALDSARSGDLVLYGAFAPAGDVSFDFELGAHGGVHPDELDHFLLHPPTVRVPFAVRCDELHRFFRARYLDGTPAGSASELGAPVGEDGRCASAWPEQAPWRGSAS